MLNEVPEHTSFAEPKDFAPIGGLPDTLTVFYDDTDGGTVHMMLAFAPAGIISWIDRYRVDDRRVQNPSPDANEIRFSINKGE